MEPKPVKLPENEMLHSYLFQDYIVIENSPKIKKDQRFINCEFTPDVLDDLLHHPAETEEIKTDDDNYFTKFRKCIKDQPITNVIIGISLLSFGGLLYTKTK